MKINKKILLCAMLACLGLSGQAQIAKWLVHPDYGNVEMTDSGLMKVSQHDKFGLLDKTGKSVLPVVYDSITTFQEGRALLFKDGSFFGFTDLGGHVVDLSGQSYQLFPGVDRFYSGLLLVVYNKQYYYLDTTGQRVLGPYAMAFPFSDNHACVKAYVNYAEDPEETYYDYIDTDGMPFQLQDEDKEDITFMSSFHNKRAILAIKKRFYVIDADSYTLTPLSVDSTFNKKSLVTAEEKEIPVLSHAEGYQVKAKNATFLFDGFMRLKRMELAGNEPQVEHFSQQAKRTYTSVFESLSGNGFYGLSFRGQALLPPQFEAILHLEDDLAIVKQDGKCGVITVDPHSNFLFKLNNNENIGFNHQYYDAKLTALMPPYIKCALATVTSHSKDCEIQIESRTENENVEGNTLGYTCRLSIPKELTDTLTTHDYFYSLNYDGLVSNPYKVTISEWYVKYYEVRLSNTHFTLSSASDTISVEFDLIKTDVARHDENNYFKTVDVVATNSAVQPILNKITENHYAFQMYGIDQERVNFSVRITEVGCPSIEYPFEMVFVKPKPRERNKKTTVTITPVRKQKPAVPEVILIE